MWPELGKILFTGFYRATASNATHGIAVAILSVRQMRVLWQN